MIILIESKYKDFSNLKRQLAATALPIHDLTKEVPLLEDLPVFEKLSLWPAKKSLINMPNNISIEEIKQLYQEFFKLRVNDPILDKDYLSYTYKGYVEGVPHFVKRYDKKLAKEFLHIVNLKRISISNMLNEGIILPLHPSTASYLFSSYSKRGLFVLGFNETLKRWPKYKEFFALLRYSG